MSQKALFFDIDGTLLSEKTKTVPASAREALQQTIDKGNLVFINTGRTYCFIPSEILALPASGFLCGCGTYLLYGDKLIYSYSIPHERGREIIQLLKDADTGILLESRDDCYLSKYPSRFKRLEESRPYLESIGVTNNGIYIEDDNFDYDKFFIRTDELTDKEKLFTGLPDMDIIDRLNGEYEIVPKGCSKGSAIDMILEYFQLSKEDAYVFGDSSNDMTMFTHAIHTIAMAQHDPVLDPYTEYVTDLVENDGIRKAMEHYHLI